MPRGKKKAMNPGLERLNQVRIDKGLATGLESDPAFAESLQEDVKSLREIDTEVDADDAMQAALDELGANPNVKVHPIANGKTIPFPDEGEPTTDYHTCRKHVPGQDRGCPAGNICPLVGKGPYNFIYKDLRSGLIKHASCLYFMKNYLKMPHIVLLDPTQETPGEAWVPTRMAEFAPLPNGQQPTPGPGQPRTRIILTPVKTRVLCVPPEGEARKIQLMRRKGSFDAPARRQRAAR